jgi:hypothetical protein
MSGRVVGCDLNGIPLDPNHPWRAPSESTPATPGGDENSSASPL